MSSTSPSSTPLILLLSSDNIPFRLSPSAATHALLLRSLLSSPSLAPALLSSGSPLPLPLPSSVLRPLVSWCEHQASLPPSSLSPSPTPSSSLFPPSSPTPFDRALITAAHTQGEGEGEGQGGVRAVYALAQGAAYLGVRAVLEAACAAVAAGIRGRGTAEMRGLLGIEEGGGFGPGEEERARAWLVDGGRRGWDEDGEGEEEEEEMGMEREMGMEGEEGRQKKMGMGMGIF